MEDMIYVRAVDYQKSVIFLEITKEQTVFNFKILQKDEFLENEVFDLANYTTCDEKAVDLQALFKPKTLALAYPSTRLNLPAISDLVQVDVGNRSREDIYLQYCFSLQGMPPLIAIFFNDTVEESIIIVNRYPVKTELPCTIAKDAKVFDLIIDTYPELKKSVDIWEARKQVMNSLDPNNSLAYMEAQLDVLSRVVFLMLDKLTDVKDYVVANLPQYEDFKQSVIENDVLRVKNIAQCLEEIQKGKSYVREVQTGYYALKEKK